MTVAEAFDLVEDRYPKDPQLPESMQAGQVIRWAVLDAQGRVCPVFRGQLFEEIRRHLWSCSSARFLEIDGVRFAIDPVTQQLTEVV